jgi:hypothetical protein
VTFWATFAIRSSPRRAPEATLPISRPVTPQTPKLSLSSAVLTAVKKCKLRVLPAQDRFKVCLGLPDRFSFPQQVV